MPTIPVAWGEVFDKLTILRIKEQKLSDLTKKQNVLRELYEIERTIGNAKQYPSQLQSLVEQLQSINMKLWSIEDNKRQCERLQKFDDHFIQLARDVYIWNDRRAAVKREINDLLGSQIIEEKQHQGYQGR